MRLPVFIARKYFFSRKNPSAINIITFIGIAGYAVGSFALVVLLSALNGFEKIIFKEYENFYPDLKLTPLSGKVFKIDSVQKKRMQSIPGILTISYTLDESAVIQNGENQVVGIVKGVDRNYFKVVKTDSFLLQGKIFKTEQNSHAWVSEGLFYKLNLGSENRNLHVMAPRRESAGVSQLELMESDLTISGIIRPGEELDPKLVVAGLAGVQELFERENEASAIEFKMETYANENEIKKQIIKISGDKFIIRNRKEQNQAIYKMFNTEKWSAFSIMALVLIIISFNLVGSLSMLILEKKKDIRILQTMGMPFQEVRKIFFSEGVLVAFSGAAVGLALGILAVFLQQTYGFVKTQSTFASAYPVQLRMSDVLLVLTLCFTLGVSGAIYPAWKSPRKH
ncbi:MAG: FtsX-like permease family protein [Bacteroidetes bacterium]|nr:FtsX-like permease family protein [Bacteroidota bacterium]